MAKYRKQRHILFLSLLSFLLGLMIMVAVHTNLAAQVNEEQDTAELIVYIKDMEQQTAELEAKVSETRAAINAIQEAQTTDQTSLTTLRSALAVFNQYAGLTELTGPGLVVTLNDNTVGAELAQKSNPAAYNAESYIVHDKDILYIVRALAQHTEALAINGIRIIDTTSIRCAGTVILVNSARLAPPYEISAIGDPTKLTAALLASSRYQGLLRGSIPVSYATADSLLVPAYSGAYPLSYSSLSGDGSAAQ